MIGEPLSEMALALERAYAAGGINFVVPDLFWIEMANIFWKAVRQQRWSVDSAHLAMLKASDYNFPTVGSYALAGEALRIAVSFARSAYDSLYLALAASVPAELITADGRLVNAVAPTLPVKWLGSINPQNLA
jgi:predicted nucleic acid-binding protein